MKNQILKDTIKTLEEASRDQDKPIWKALAKELDKPKRRRTSINLSRINRYTKEDEVVAVPGKVLASGHLRHPVKVAAFSFSDMAAQKIKDAKGETMSLVELLESGIEPGKIRIMK